MKASANNNTDSIHALTQSLDQKSAAYQQKSVPAQQRGTTSLSREGQSGQSRIEVQQRETDTAGVSPRKHKHKATSLKGIKERWFGSKSNRIADQRGSTETPTIANTSRLASPLSHAQLQEHSPNIRHSGTEGHDHVVRERFTERLQSPDLRSAALKKTNLNVIDEVSVNTQQKPPVSHIAGPDGFFYFVNQQGDLHRYDPTVNEVLHTGLTGVDQVSLGADGQIYARKGDQLCTLDRSGIPRDDIPVHHMDIPGEVQDVAVSGSKDRLFVLNTGGELFQRNADVENPAVGQTQPVSLPMELMTAEPRSIACDANSSLWLMDASGAVWHGVTGDDGRQWQKLPDTEHHFTRLDTLPDGSVGAKDLDGGSHRFEKASNSWHKVAMTEVNQTLFGRLHGALPTHNKAELITFLGGVATARPASSNPLKHPIQSLSNVAKSIPKLYRDLKHFDYSKQQQHPMARYDAQVMSFFKLLAPENLRTVDRNAIGSAEGMAQFSRLLDNGPGSAATSRCKQLLEQITKDKSDPTLQKELRMPKGAASTDNVLERIKVVREMLYGSNDEVVQQLNTLLEQGTHVSMDASRYRAALSSLVVDHAVMAELAHKTLNKGVPMEDALAEAQSIRNQALPNLVARSGIADTDPFGNAAKGFDAMQAILRQEGDMLPRMIKNYAPAMGWKLERQPSMSEAAELFGRLAHTMKPGDSISMGKSSDNGFNTENFRVVLSGAWAKLTGGVAVTWLIPILDIGKLKGAGMSIAKTDDGIRVEMSSSRGSYMQAGLRTGLGVVGLPQLMPEKHGGTWAFGGWEIAVKGKKTDNVNDSIAFTIKDNGDGNIGRVLRDLMTGQADLFGLMRQSEEVDSVHGKGRNWNLGVANVLVGWGGTDQRGWGALDAPKIPGTTGKILGAIVPELALDFGSKSAESTSTSSTGQTSRSNMQQGFGLQSVRGNLIGVGVLESDYLKVPLPGDMMLGSGPDNASAPGLTGRMGIPSLLPGVILGKGFDRLSPTARTVTLTSDSRGEPVNIDVQLSVNRTSKLLKRIDKYGDLQKQIPGLKQALKQITHQQGNAWINSNKPVSVSMELKPDVLERIKADTPQGGASRLEAMKAAAKDLKNFRLKELNVSHSHEAKKGSPLVIPARTRAINASLGATTPFANLKLVYDKDTVLKHGESLIRSIGSFDDGAWGTSARQFRLTRLTHQLENMVDALGQPPEKWDHGDSLKQVYQQQRNALKDDFTQTLRKLMTAKATPETLKSVEGAFHELVAKLDSLKEKHGIGSFLSPAVITHGPLFDKPDAGKLNHLDDGLQPKDDMLWTKAIKLIDELAEMDLSTLKAKKLGKQKTEAQEKVDGVKRAVSAVADAVPEFKQDLYARLDLLAARPTERELLAEVKRMLVKMNMPG